MRQQRITIYRLTTVPCIRLTVDGATWQGKSAVKPGERGLLVDSYISVHIPCCNLPRDCRVQTGDMIVLGDCVVPASDASIQTLRGGNMPCMAISAIAYHNNGSTRLQHLEVTGK